MSTRNKSLKMFFLFTNCTSGIQGLTLDLHYVWKHISQPMQTLPLISLSVSSSIGHNLCEANPWKTLAAPPMWAADAWSKSPTPLWLSPVPAQLQEKPRGLSARARDKLHSTICTEEPVNGCSLKEGGVWWATDQTVHLSSPSHVDFLLQAPEGL